MAATPGVTRFTPDGLVRTPAFSHVAVVPPGASTIYIGGQNAVDASGALVGGDDVGAQTVQVFDNLVTALTAADATLADVVQWRVAVVEGVDVRPAFAEFQRRWDPELAPPLIAVTTVAGLAVPGALLELEAVAAVYGDAGSRSFLAD